MNKTPSCRSDSTLAFGIQYLVDSDIRCETFSPLFSTFFFSFFLCSFLLLSTLCLLRTFKEMQRLDPTLTTPASKAPASLFLSGLSLVGLLWSASVSASVWIACLHLARMCNVSWISRRYFVGKSFGVSSVLLSFEPFRLWLTIYVQERDGCVGCTDPLTSAAGALPLQESINGACGVQGLSCSCLSRVWPRPSLIITCKWRKRKQLRV